MGFRLVITEPPNYRARATCAAWAAALADATTDDSDDGEERGAWTRPASQFKHFDAWLNPDPNPIFPAQAEAAARFVGPTILQSLGAGQSEGADCGWLPNSECFIHRS